MKEIEQSAFSTWSGLNSLVLEYDKNVGVPPGQLFQNLSGIYVQRLYVKGKMYGDVYFHGFEAPNLLALAIYKSDVDMFDFGSLTAKNTVEWLDISGNKLVTIDSVEKMLKLRYLNVNNQTPDICMEIGNGTSGRRFPDNLDFIDLSDTLLCNIPTLGDIPFKVVNLSHSNFPIVPWVLAEKCVNDPKLPIISLDLQDAGLCSGQEFFAFCDWSALNVINLSNNELGLNGEFCSDAENSHIMGFLKPFWNLTELYLDSNYMEYDLPPNMLVNQQQLQSLHVSKMSLTNMTVKIRHLTQLKFLDLSSNKIQCFYTQTMRDINTIIGYTPVRRNVTITLEMNMIHNPFYCGCSCLEFYQWMRNVRPYITYTDLGSYQCIFDNGRKANMSNLNLIVDILYSHCTPTDRSPAMRMVITILTVYIFISTVTISFRFRYTLKYIWLKYKMHRQYLERKLLDPKYVFDAFVSCARADAIWIKRNFLPKLENQETQMKFCVAQRDFIVGVTIIDNIVRNITQSRKVVYVISQEFLKSGWCKEELLIGRQESLSRGKNILICIFMPDIIYNQLSDRFRFILNHVTCIKWPRDPAAQQVFWIMLQRALLDGEEIKDKAPVE